MTKAPKLMDTKTYTKKFVLLEFGEESEFWQAYRTMDDDARKTALDKLNLAQQRESKPLSRRKF